MERSIYIAIHGNIQEAYDTFQRLVGKLKLGGGGGVEVREGELEREGKRGERKGEGQNWR